MSCHSILRDPARTKSTAFSLEERDRLGIRGLLPYAVTDIECQKSRVLENLRRKENDLERYICLTALHDRNETLFYRLLMDHIEELMPVIYTPTVGLACREFANIFRRPRGFYVTQRDRGQIRDLLDNWPVDDVRIIVVTDGERILGLGDLGANGMGIPIGKLALYSTCAGIHPKHCLPVMLDVGTNNIDLRNDPLYLGYPHARLTGSAYFELVDEFMRAVKDKYPQAVVQFEDFLTPNAYKLLHRYRYDYRCFNDDIQGTAAVVLAGVLSSTRLTKRSFKDLKIMFLGAGSAATGIGDLMVQAFQAEGLSETEARRRLWYVDIEGLVVRSRKDLPPHILPYAHDISNMGFPAALDKFKPDVLIGASGAAGTFNQEIVRKMAAYNERPVIFALSNPTECAECSAEQVYEWSEGRAIFASGSPFDPVTLKNGSKRVPAQGNNAYIFPGIGLGAYVAQSAHLPNDLFITAAKTLAQCTSDADLESGSLYPSIARIQKVSEQIALSVAESVFAKQLNEVQKPDNLLLAMRQASYDPDYGDGCAEE